MPRGLAKTRAALLGQTEGGESCDFSPTTFVNADLSQLLAEIRRSVAVAE
jgi:hypothetical protein